MAINTNSDIADINKCNADDLNEIKSVVNTNATALDNLTAQVNDKNIMTISLANDFTMAQTNVFYNITGFAVESSVGNKLTFNNNEIHIGSGVSKVKVCYSAKIQSVNTTRTFVYLTMNGVTTSQEGWWPGASTQQSTVGITPRLINVSEGDYFSIACYGTQNTKILGSNGLSFVITTLTVEVIE